MRFALTAVQDVELEYSKELSWLVSEFYTEFSTAVLKIVHHTPTKMAAQLSGRRRKLLAT